MKQLKGAEARGYRASIQVGRCSASHTNRLLVNGTERLDAAILTVGEDHRRPAIVRLTCLTIERAPLSSSCFSAGLPADSS
jgi:hypothetical protein